MGIKGRYEFLNDMLDVSLSCYPV